MFVNWVAKNGFCEMEAVSNYLYLHHFIILLSPLVQRSHGP